MKFIQGIIATIQRRRTARQMRVAQHRALAKELNELHYTMIHTCLKEVIEKIENGDIDDLRIRRVLTRATRDILLQARTPERADIPTPVSTTQVI